MTTAGYFFVIEWIQIMEREKIIERARKLNELAKRGVGGEASNAIGFLKSWKEKYNITDKELEEDFFKEVIITWERLSEKLVILSCFEVFGGHSYAIGRGYREDKEGKKIFINLTFEEKEKIKKLFFKSYKKIYKLDPKVTIE